LNIGKPGSSYTFLVAERSGLPRELIKNARRKVARKNLLLEKLLTDVEREKENIKNKLSEADANDKKLKALIKKYEALSLSTENDFNAKEAKLKKLEERLHRESEERFREFLKEWKKTKDKKILLDKYYRQFVQKKKVIDPKVIERQRQEKLIKLKNILKPGLKVRLENGHTIGVVEQIDDDKAYVIFGQFRTLCDIVNLMPVEETSEIKKSK
jgi:DNA mismatch repair protein MutS2